MFEKCKLDSFLAKPVVKDLLRNSIIEGMTHQSGASLEKWCNFNMSVVIAEERMDEAIKAIHARFLESSD